MKTQSKFSVYFTLRMDKEKAGCAPLYVAITLNKEKSMVALKKQIAVGLWDTGKGLARGHKEEAKDLNRYLNEVRTVITNIHNDLQLKGKAITASTIKGLFLGEEEHGYTLTKLIDYHNEVSNKVLNPATLKHYSVSQRYLIKFLKAKYSMDDIALKDLDFEFIQDFDSFLRNHKPLDHHRPLSNNGVTVHMIRLKKMVHLAHNLAWISRDPFDSYKLRMKKVSRQYLTEAELSRIELKSFGTERLDMIKDIFIFCCYTGLTYVDLMSLKKTNIVINSDDDAWIRTYREKTSVPVNIPLLSRALQILKKYDNNERALYNGTVFPVISNQKVNSYLKEISEICAVHKNLTFHMARHTFATTVTLSNGMPIETVSKILGHTKIATTQIYARVVERKLKEDMQMLQSKLSPI